MYHQGVLWKLNSHHLCKGRIIKEDILCITNMKNPVCISLLIVNFYSSWSQQTLFLFLAALLTLGKLLNLSVDQTGSERCHQMVPHSLSTLKF